MPDLLLELFSEEIPARMQRRAAEDLRRLVTDALVAAGLTYEGAKAFATPRRLALTVQGLPPAQPAGVEERKGPRVGAPAKAIEGFVKAAGLARIEDAETRDDGKGPYYVAVNRRAGRTTPALLADLVPEVVKGFPWPKSMRWGSGTLRWVRPLHGILCTFAVDNDASEVVAFSVDGIVSGDVTFGHRVHAPGPIRVRRFADYMASLEAARVVLDADRRKDIIRADAHNLALAHQLDLVEDEALLEEVAGLVEWPVVLMGRFEEAFLEVPEEVVRTTIRANQKCFVLRGTDGALANRFVVVANLDASDGGAAVVAGNERVVRARLADARFFWESDLAVPLEQRLDRLDHVVFHERLGSQGERVRRLVGLAREIAPRVGADPDLAAEAARLAKADLASETVGEFPELQGTAGGHLARAQGCDPRVADAIAEHYRPQGPRDRVPAEPVGIAVALADKLDMLAGFWAIGEKPTGSKDPYGLRRAALGVIRIVLENGCRLPLGRILLFAYGQAAAAVYRQGIEGTLEAESRRLGIDLVSEITDEAVEDDSRRDLRRRALADIDDLLAFFADRLKVQLREEGARHDLVDAVFALGGQDDFVLVARRIAALGTFLSGEDGKSLLVGYRRAANILRAEEKRDGAGAFAAPVDPALLRETDEIALGAALERTETEARTAVAAEDFVSAMAALARLRPAVDRFFETVTVNAEDPMLRANRLRLLDRLRGATRTVADFSRIEG